MVSCTIGVGSWAYVKGIGASLPTPLVLAVEIECGGTSRISAVVSSNDGRHVVSDSFDESALMWNGDTGEIEHVVEGLSS